MTWEVEYSNEFGAWWDGLSDAEQDSVSATVGLLEHLSELIKEGLIDG